MRSFHSSLSRLFGRVAILFAFASVALFAGTVDDPVWPSGWGPVNLPGDYSWNQSTPFSDPGALGNLGNMGSGTFLMTGNSANDPGGSLQTFGSNNAPLSDAGPTTPEPSTGLLALGVGLVVLGTRRRRLNRKVAE